MENILTYGSHLIVFLYCFPELIIRSDIFSASMSRCRQYWLQSAPDRFTYKLWTVDDQEAGMGMH